MTTEYFSNKTTITARALFVGKRIDTKPFDKPEILWELPEVEPLYMRLADEFEITERSTAVRHKLDLLYRTAETMSGLLQDKRTLHVEWYIVILIVIDILMSLAEKYLGF